MFKPQCRSLLAVSVILLSNSLQAQLTITSSANLVTSNGTYITLNNTGLSNSGTINTAGSSTIVFSGTASAASTPLNSASAISNITINKAAGGVLLGSNIPISNTVQLTSGILNLNGFDLNLGTTGSLSGESASSYITGATGGAVVRTATLNSPVAVNPGNIGIAITSSSNLGTTTIRRSHQIQTITGTANSIARYFDVAPTNTSGLNTTVRLSYLDNELNGLSKSSLGFYSSVNSGTTWVGLGSSNQDVANNYVEKTFILFNARLTLANNSAILPIGLISFTGKLTPSGGELQWVTATEQNNRLFEVEHSDDGIIFSRFATISSRGNSSSPQTYIATDAKPFSTVQFYRLKQINTDGSSTYSKVVALSREAFANKVINVFPNPAHSVLQVNFTSSGRTKVSLQVVNSEGRPVMNQNIQASTGLNNLTLAISSLPAGSYYIRCAGISTEPIHFTKIN